MRVAPSPAAALVVAFTLLLAACSKESAAPEGREQAVIDKADQDVIAAQAEAEAPAPAPTASAASAPTASAP
jgi:hypothetical protein